MKNNLKKSGSALLLSFFMMTILVLVAISVSIFVIHDVRTVRTIVAGEKAFYIAEGMSEMGLDTVNQNMPGYELAVDLSSEEIASSYDLVALDGETSGTMPCESQGGGFIALSKNESIQIPLFYQIDADGNTQNIDNFTVEFYRGDVEGNPSLSETSASILRWKVLGLRSSGSSVKTEAMSEYIPLVSGHNSKESPSTLGTLSDGSTDYSSGKSFTSNYGGVSVKFRYYPIVDFLRDHTHSYLVLTNVVTEDLLSGPGQDASYVHIRFLTSGTPAVCEYAQVNAIGTELLQNVRQELVTLLREGESLPVFDFVLYHTTGE